MRILKQSTAQNRTFFMIDSSDHISGKTGLTCTVTISKDGGSFGALGGTVTELSNGWYKIALNTTDTGTLGDLSFHVTGTGADPVDWTDFVTVRSLDDLTFPATSGRSSAINSSGQIGVDWANVGGQSTSVNLSATTTNLVNTCSTLSGHVAQTGDSFARIGVAGVGLTNLGDTRIAHLNADVSSRSSHSASDVWAVGTRTLTSFGTLVSDIWSSGTRTLTGFGTLVSDITADVWAATTRTLTAFSFTPSVTVSDKTGFSLSTAGILAIWHQVTSSIVTAGTIGKLILDNLDAAISSLTFSAPTAVEIRTEMDSNSTKLTAIKNKTDLIPSDIATSLAHLDRDISSRVAASAYVVPDNTSILEIKSKTDNLPADPAATSDIPTTTDIQNAMADELDVAGTELDSIPDTSGSLRNKINYVFQKFRNKRTITSSQEDMYKEDDSTVLGSNTVADDNTTVTIGKSA